MASDKCNLPIRSAHPRRLVYAIIKSAKGFSTQEAYLFCDGEDYAEDNGGFEDHTWRIVDKENVEIFKKNEKLLSTNKERGNRLVYKHTSEMNFWSFDVIYWEYVNQ